jgi:hypothetical protein
MYHESIGLLKGKDNREPLSLRRAKFISVRVLTGGRAMMIKIIWDNQYLFPPPTRGGGN